MNEKIPDPKIKPSHVGKFIESAKEGFVGIDNEVKKNNISIEVGDSMKKYHRSNMLFLCIKWVALPYAVATTSYNILDFAKMATSKFDPNDITNSITQALNFTFENSLILSPYAALLATSLYVTTYYANNIKKMINEHENLQPFKNELLDIVTINKNSQIKDELTSDKLHKIYLISAFMQGSSTKETIGNILGTVGSLKKLWSDEGLKIFDNFWKKIKKSFKNEKLKTVSALMKDFNDPQEELNLSYLRKMKLDQYKLHNKKELKEMLNEFNKQAINTASKTYASQNLQLVFARIVQEILKSDNPASKELHKKILEKFEDLHRVTAVKDFFDDNKLKSPLVMKRISKIANDLLEGTSNLTKDSKLKDIVESINPSMIIDEKIKYGSFEKHIKEAKVRIIKNRPEDYYKLNTYHRNDTLIDTSDLEKIISIDEEKARRKLNASNLIGNKKSKKPQDNG